ncbi:MAG TPA: IS1380 family transposase, partial [Candidatus Binatia bacterium]|nr:IS1380 family transposase [Candidatus Binatia bacterium]
NLTCVAKRRYTAMPKSVDPAWPAQAELRCLAIGNDFDRLRRDPAFALAYGRLPDSGRDLCSQGS